VDPNAGPVGVEIQATPPGKRLKAIALLSGGERALVSIALICAIMATNPSPFVVLDEVDAALDESNSQKFAEIVSTLADRTQFVIVTHNRATMQRGHLLYGVSMGDDGVSQLLSVKLNEISEKP
jgi:chromosome segregation protein